VSTLDHMLGPEAVRRIEVITGTGRRRRFSDDDKARIVEETLVPGAVISAIARRHGLTPQQLFSWRRQARQPVTAIVEAPPLFVPAVVETDPGKPRRKVRRKKRLEPGAAAIIEVAIGGVAVKIGRGVDAKTIAAVIRALKAGA
jgi:transposase